MNNECSPKLGMELSRLEDRCYRIIFLNKATPISSDKISEQFFHLTDIGQSEKAAVWEIISGIRDKLGKNEIIYIHGNGYVSRRMLINEMVKYKGTIGINDIVSRIKS